LKSIGLLGGSFDPPHKGHLYISLEAKKLLKLKEIWWLVTPQNPLKISKPASYVDRVQNCCIFTKGQPIKISEIENKINSTHTYESLNYIQNHYKNIKFFWLMGADNLINFHKWQKWREIFNNISIVVFKRHGYNNKALNSITKKTFAQFQVLANSLNQSNFKQLPSWSLIKNKEIKISSTEIRKQRELLRGSYY
jgi:nicotinate-nucleotide adenylyltransferase